MEQLPKVLLVAMGGTISAHHPRRCELRQYRTGHYSGQELVDALPELQAIAQVKVKQLDNITSTGITFQHWVELKQLLERAATENFSGVVITHGTNTLEETAYFLHLTLNTEMPVVFTGSQRPFSALSSDAALNLINAVRVAAEPSCVGLGVLVAMNDKVYSARDVSKTHSYHVESFQALNTGPLGTIDADRQIRIHAKPLRKHTINSKFTSKITATEPYIPILYSYAGADQRLLDSLLAMHKPAGLVIAGTGAGRCSPLEEQALHRAVQLNIPIVMSSRLASGRILSLESYDHLQLITADNLPPQKARILLMLCLMQELPIAEVQYCFDNH
ncbi:asparaginase [Aliidiomarina quisquiliarum]|uniref:asparaginase n=1 Tax=Aliidiomarina quisquiliarum TaxID=2938947 RepID=UPI00208E6F5A|nr:asparaginase [Aliidiomarina quisquiliarum]